MKERIFEIVRKEFRQALREPRMRAILVVPPLAQLLIFGYAVNLDIENSRIAWMDADRTPASRELLAAFEGSRRFQVVATPSTDAEVQDLLDRGRVQAVIRVMPNFERELMRGETAPVQVLVDGANSNTASLITGYASQIVAGFAGRSPSIMRPRVWFNPDLRSRNYFVPGVVVNIIMIVTLMLTALAIVREKEIGTMEQLMVTPIRPIELMIGKTLPFAIVGLFELVLITSAALLVFRIPLRGSPLLLLVASIFFLLTTLGAGLLISTISRTQQQAMMSSFFFIMPAFMLSGFTFPVRNFPPIVQYLTYVNPIRYYMEVVRGIFLKGVGLSVLWPQMLAMLVFGLGVLCLGALRFRKRLD